MPGGKPFRKGNVSEAACNISRTAKDTANRLPYQAGDTGQRVGDVCVQNDIGAGV